MGTDFAVGTMDIDLTTVVAFMQFFDPATDTSSGGGLLMGGALTFTSVSTTAGGAVVGSLVSEVFAFF